MSVAAERARQRRSVEENLDMRVDNMMQDACKKSDEHRRVFDTAYPLYISSVLNKYGADDRITALKGIIDAVQIISWRARMNPRAMTNTIEIDLAAAVAVKHPEMFKYLTDHMREEQIGAFNVSQIASSYGVSDCLPKQAYKSAPKLPQSMITGYTF
jgi:hypothetical protein